MNQHPLSAAFPKMPSADFKALGEDIKVNGLRDPIVVYEGQVLDGWHRWQVCDGLGIEPMQTSLPAALDPIAFVISRNLHRRHLSASQRAVAVASCHEWHPVGRSAKVEPGSTLKEMAKKAEVSERTMRDATDVIKAGKKDEVLNGNASVKSIARPKKPKKPAPEPEPGDPSEADIVASTEFLLQDSERQISELSALVESLQKPDLAKELIIQKKKWDALNGRCHQLNETNSQLVSTAGYLRKQFEAVKKVLNVQKDNEVIPAIKALL